MANIRSIQHYLYCPRQFGLLEINKDWAENAFVVRGNIVHENVHSGRHNYKTAKKFELSSVTVYNDELDLYGITDCIEFERSKEAGTAKLPDGTYKVKLIEYKPTQSKAKEVREADAIQVFAQKLCADSIWNCESEGYLYYADTRNRIKLPLNEEYDRYYALITRLLDEMRECVESGVIPPRSTGQKCGGCSVKDLCMPQQKPYSIRDIVSREEDICESF